MSMDMGGMASGTDYSDFEYQTFNGELRVREAADATGEGNVNAGGVFTYEPLESVGGLDNNEVAELVYLETHAALEFEDESADQDVGTQAEMRGVVGINLGPSQNSLPEGRNSEIDTADIFTTGDIDEANIQTAAANSSEDKWLQPFRSLGSPPFDDETNGPGGSATHEQFHSEKKYRDLTGRGPVLDQNDDLSIGIRTNAGDIVMNYTANVRCHAIWDVAETSDAGRAFSVPDGV